MEQNELLKMLEAGFTRFYNEGSSKWSKNDVIAAINPIGEKMEIQDPKVQNVLKELERRKLIRLVYDNDLYLEVLHD